MSLFVPCFTSSCLVASVSRQHVLPQLERQGSFFQFFPEEQVASYCLQVSAPLSTKKLAEEKIEEASDRRRAEYELMISCLSGRSSLSVSGCPRSCCAGMEWWWLFPLQKNVDWPGKNSPILEKVHKPPNFKSLWIKSRLRIPPCSPGENHAIAAQQFDRGFLGTPE